MPSVAASPLSPILTVSAVSAERVVVPGRVAVTVTVVSSAASPALSGLSARVMAPEGAASSSVIVMVSPVTVRPDEVPATLIVSFASSMTSFVGVRVKVFAPLAAPAAIAMVRSATSV